MTIRKNCGALGHPALGKRALEVRRWRAIPKSSAWSRTMVETMDRCQWGRGSPATPGARGRALSWSFQAPARRVPIQGLAQGEAFRPHGRRLTILINPVIEGSGPRGRGRPGRGLSVGPQVCRRAGSSGRPIIRYRGVGLDGKAIERVAKGPFTPRVVQHECDHLDGILYPQRMTDCDQIDFRERDQALAPSPRTNERSGFTAR